MGGTFGFGFKIPYKLQVATQRKRLNILRIELLHFQVHMNCEFFQDLIASLPFEQLSKETQALVNNIKSTHAEVMDTERMVTKQSVQEIAVGAEVAALEVAKILAEIPKYLITSRPKLTPNQGDHERQERKVACRTGVHIAKMKPTKAHCPGGRQGYKPRSRRGGYRRHPHG